MLAKFIEFMCLAGVCAASLQPLRYGDNRNLRTLKISVGIFGIDTKLFDSFIHIRLFCSFWLPEVYRADSAARYLGTASEITNTHSTANLRNVCRRVVVSVSAWWNV